MSEKERISDEWLRATGFKWSQIERQPSRHWILWLGSCLNVAPDGERPLFASRDDLGIEIASASWVGRTGIVFYPDVWHCWLRADTAGLYHRFLHVRHLRYTDEVVQMIEALTGQAWNPENNIGGSMLHPRDAEWRRAEYDRLDRRLVKDRTKWSEAEKDGDRARPSVDHLNAAIESGKSA